MRFLTTILLVVLGMSANAAAQKDASGFLPRSVYATLVMATCEHIQQAVLYHSSESGDELMALAVLPAERKFQFTFFPTLGRFEPQRSIIKMVGTLEGEKTWQYVTLTASEVFLSHTKSIKLDSDGKVAYCFAHKYKADARHEPVVIRFQCARCAAKEGVRVAAK